MINILLFLAFLTKIFSESLDSDPFIVEVKNGKLRGKAFNSSDENNFPYLGFRGIPFGEPPVGLNRFQPPQPKENWEGTLDATEESPGCLQPKINPNETVSEDCLYLNVYTPKVDGEYPVMVYIYGGAFIGGSTRKSVYGPDFLIQENVVIVLPNYRLGIFGFLSTEDEVAPGNYGLKDQILALQWVQDNIRSFGGNPDNVLLFGESAGSVCVSLLLQAESAKGLFHGAIMESGVSLSAFGLTRNPRNLVLYTAKGLNISETSSQEIVSKLRRIEAQTLLRASIENYLTVTMLSNPLNGLVFGPSIEPPLEGAVYTEKSYGQLKDGNFTRVPIIVGFNSAEGNAFSPLATGVPLFLLKYDFNHQLLVPASMNVNKSSLSEVGSSIKQYYFGNKTIRSQEILLSKFITDDQFIRPTNEYVRLISKYTTTYLYEFAYVGRIPGAIRNLPGVSHAEDNNYLWKFGSNDIGVEDFPIRRKFVKMWTNFAKYRNPTPTEDVDLDNVIWQSSNAIDIPFLLINSTMEIDTNPREKDIQFWSTLYEAYGNPPYDTY